MSGTPPSVQAASLVWDHWQRHAAEAPEREAVVHMALGQEPVRWRWGELVRAAGWFAVQLKARGVRPGEVCALVVRHNPLFYPLYLGISRLGAIPTVLAYPNARLHPEKFRQGLEGMARHSGLDHVLTERELSPWIEPVLGPRSTVQGLHLPLEWAGGETWRAGGEVPEGHGSPAEPCLLQHSSGTTGLQKPVALSHRAVLEHVARYAEAIGLSSEDRVVSWLPLYHDMGLIAAFYMPLLRGVPLVLLSPMEWVSVPASLLQVAARERATLCWLPNFAFNFMADRVRDEDLAGVRLEGLRLLVNCSEAVRAESHERFLRRFGPYGLRPAALAACYAMAETTYAVSQTEPGQAPATLEVDRAALARGEVVPVAPGTGRRCVSSGRPIAGCQVRVVDEARRDMPPGRVGELAISSVSLFDGYRHHPEKTARVLADGWYYSGDLGFLHEGECFVIGRAKDVIIVAGNNVLPEDVEDAVGQVPGMLPGRVVAFGLDDERAGTEALCVVAETEAADPADRRALRIAVLKVGMAIDVTIARIYLVEPRWLVKSSAGKPARSTNRERALAQLPWPPPKEA